MLGESDRARTVLILLTVCWTAALSWIYMTAILHVQSFTVLSPVLTSVIALGLSGLLVWFVEARLGRRAAVMTLLVLLVAQAAYLVIKAQVLFAGAAAGFVLAGAYGYGAFIAPRLDLDELRGAWQCVPLRMTLGLCVVIVLGIALGVVGWLSRTAVAVVLIAGVGMAVMQSRRLPEADRWEAPYPATPLAVSWWWGLAALLLIGIVEAVAPEIRHDALAAHLPIAREFAARGAIVAMRENIGSYLQLNATLLYAMGMLLVPGEAVPKLLHYGAGVLASFVVYDLGARLWQPRVGLTAAVVVAGTPLVWWVGSTAYSDLWAVLFAACAVAGLARFAQRPSPRRALAVGLLAGTAVGVKITSLIVALPLAMPVLWMGALPPSRLRGVGRTLIVFTLGAALTGAFWYGRAWVLTGNPVFPLLNGIFKSPLWSAENPRLSPELSGMGTGVWDLLLLPWRLTRFPERFVEDGTIGITYLALLPPALWAIARGVVPRWLWGIILAGGLVWVLSAQYLRYLLPLLPLAALVGAAGLMGGGVSRSAAGPSVLILILGIGAAAVGWMSTTPYAESIKIATERITRDEYTAQFVAGFPVAQYVRRALSASARLYGAGEPRSFYYDRYFVSLSRLGREFDPALRRAVVRARTAAEVRALLLRNGFTHLVVNRLDPFMTRRTVGDTWLTREALWEQGPRLDYAYTEVYLFTLASPDARARGSELLHNPEMLLGPTGAPAGWESHGTVGFVPAVAGSAGADRRVRLSGDAYVVQRVPVRPDGLYVLEAEARFAGPEAEARLSIEWRDENGRVLDYTTWRQVVVGPEPRRYAMACTAPVRTRTALIWLIAKRGDVEFSRPHFYELR